MIIVNNFIDIHCEKLLKKFYRANEPINPIIPVVEDVKVNNLTLRKETETSQSGMLYNLSYR